MFETPNNVLKSIQMLDENTLEIVFNDKASIDVDDLKMGYRYLEEIAGDKPHKKLVVTGKQTTITKEARLFGHQQSLQIKNRVIAEAIIVHSLPQKMVINFYTKFIKDSYPTRYFTDFEKAKSWLMNY